MYHLTKNGIHYLIKADHIKTNLSMDSIAQLNKFVNAGKHLTFVFVKCDDLYKEQKEVLQHKNIQYIGLQPMNETFIIECPINKIKYIVGQNSFPYMCTNMLLIFLLLMSGLQLVKVTRDIDIYCIEGIFTLINKLFL